MQQTDLTTIQNLLDINFKNTNLLVKAFTHRSYLNETDDQTTESNERLEFLGDSILQFLSSKKLFELLPNYDEGLLTNLRSKIVNTNSLAQESTRLGLGQFLLISKGEKSTATSSKHILANTFEALLGAIFLEKGLDTCQKFLDTNLFYKIQTIIDTGLLKDYKSMYQELAQEKYSITPNYKVLSEIGPDHQKTFEIAVYLDKDQIAKGQGSSKRIAQQEAAYNALIQEKAIKSDDKTQ